MLFFRYTNTRQFDMPRRALQCLEIILKGAYQQNHLKNGVRAGRSFYMPPNGRPQYLGDCFELWYGLFQATVLGDIPYLNVDILHKAFPKRYDSLVDLLNDIERECSRNRFPVNAFDKMKQHLNGLDVIYTAPWTGVRKIYKFMEFGEKPEKHFFKDDTNQSISVANYFQSRNYSIRYRDYPCVILGIRRIAVPMECCSLSDRQVFSYKKH